MPTDIDGTRVRLLSPTPTSFNNLDAGYEGFVAVTDAPHHAAEALPVSEVSATLTATTCVERFKEDSNESPPVVLRCANASRV